MTGASASIPLALVEELTAAGVVTRLNEPLSRYSTFRIGGTCPAVINAPNEQAFRKAWVKCLKAGMNPFLLGGGSNLLFSDHGFNRPVVRYVEDAPSIAANDLLVRVSAGTSLDDLARVTAERGLGGLVVCSGIPGTVGGAVAGNAGAFGEQIGDSIVSLQVVDASGVECVKSRDELGFAYRSSVIPARRWVVVSATLQLTRGDAHALMARRREILDLRASKHPDWKTVPTAGSFFKNIEPTSKAERRQAAGWFLEQAGALSMRVGGARTFERHANIVVADPGCTASDILKLTTMMADAVRDKFGIILEPEVKFVGEE